MNQFIYRAWVSQQNILKQTVVIYGSTATVQLFDASETLFKNSTENEPELLSMSDWLNQPEPNSKPLFLYPFAILIYHPIIFKILLKFFPI